MKIEEKWKRVCDLHAELAVLKAERKELNGRIKEIDARVESLVTLGVDPADADTDQTEIPGARRLSETLGSPTHLSVVSDDGYEAEVDLPPKPVVPKRKSKRAAKRAVRHTLSSTRPGE